MDFKPDPNVPLWDQIKALRQDKDDWNWEWNRRLEILIEARDAEREAELPHATCCEGAKLIYARLPYPKEDGTQSPPHWELRFKKDYPNRHSPEECKEVHFCPFCGTRLPGFRPKANPPPHIYDVDDEYWCNGCEDSHTCICSAPVSAWEVE